MLGIGQENHNRLSEESNRLIIDCTIRFLFAVSNNIQRSLKEYQKPEHICSWLKTDCQKCKVIISCQRCKVIQFTVKKSPVNAKGCLKSGSLFYLQQSHILSKGVSSS